MALVCTYDTLILQTSEAASSGLCSITPQAEGRRLDPLTCLIYICDILSTGWWQMEMKEIFAEWSHQTWRCVLYK